MSQNLKFDYYYGSRSEQFSYYQIPTLLVKAAVFKEVSLPAKFAYGLLLNRTSLSRKNGWLDEQNRAYIIYSIDELMTDLNVSKPTCIKALRELDSESGIGLIEREKRGLGRPDINVEIHRER